MSSQRKYIGRQGHYIKLTLEPDNFHRTLSFLLAVWIVQQKVVSHRLTIAFYVNPLNHYAAIDALDENCSYYTILLSAPVTSSYFVSIICRSISIMVDNFGMIRIWNDKFYTFSIADQLVNYGILMYCYIYFLIFTYPMLLVWDLSNDSIPQK